MKALRRLHATVPARPTSTTSRNPTRPSSHAPARAAGRGRCDAERAPQHSRCCVVVHGPRRRGARPAAGRGVQLALRHEARLYDADRGRGWSRRGGRAERLPNGLPPIEVLGHGHEGVAAPARLEARGDAGADSNSRKTTVTGASKRVGGIGTSLDSAHT